jgi:hypothetical protein
MALTDNDITVNALNAGSFGNHDDQATFNQDYVGGITVDSTRSTINMYGNAWKAFELKSPHLVTARTHAIFQYQHLNEAEGHAICFEEDLNEDPFQGTHVRCVMLAGRQFTKWKHVRRVNLAIGQPTSQIHKLDAELAVDGNRNTFSNTGKRNNPWWQVQINQSFTVTDIVMHNRFDVYTDRLTAFTVRIFQGETELYKESFQNQIAAETMYIEDIDIDESLLDDDEQMFVRITLDGDNIPHMLGEVEIFGNPKTGRYVSFDVNIGDLFRTSETYISYVAFIQDNDANPLVGQSSMRSITLVERDVVQDQGTIPYVSVSLLIMLTTFFYNFSKHLLRRL